MAQPHCEKMAGAFIHCRLLAAVLAICLSSFAQPNEYEVKAAFLLNFTRFIEWPQSEHGIDGAMTICILGEDPFGPFLSQIVEGETVNGLRLVIERSRREMPKSCQVLYVGNSERGAREILTRVGRDVLTVGEGESFLHEGGMIAFVLDNRRVRFSINLTAVHNSALKFSSKLLSVAKSVEK